MIFSKLFPSLSPLAEMGSGWGTWWLPPNYSTHGGGIDSLFNWIFWITMIIFVVVELILIVFLIKYRARPERKKATFIHGHARLEMAWTIAPAVILLFLALASKKVWDDYRYSPIAQDPDRAIVLVVGEQFKWNVVYSGPDGKLGKYLVFPRPTDVKYRHLAYKDAIRKINMDISQENPLGQDLTADPAGKDDDYVKSPGRPLILPANHPVEVQLSSKDVLHDFFLPNFRVKLDAVPGLRGNVYFQSTKQSTQTCSIDDPKIIGKSIWIDKDSQGAEWDRRTKEYWIPDPTDEKRRKSLARHLKTIDIETVARLKENGITQVTAVVSPFEIVCEELCGQGHATMRGDLIFVSRQEFENFINKGAPTTQPAVALNGAD